MAAMKKQTGSELKKTAKHSAIYAVGNMISRLTGLVMLPIYTRYLTPADYGVLELFTIAIELMGILVGVRITQAMFRYYILEDDPQQKKIIVSTVLLTVILASGTGTAILFHSSGLFSSLLFGSNDYLFEFELFAFTLMTNTISAVGLAYIRARRKPVLFVSVGVITLALQVAFNILFVVHLDMHVTGVVYGALLSGGLVSLALTLYVVAGVGLHYSRAVARKLVAFVAPLILASLGSFFVAYADKYFIRLYGTLADVGLYVLAARISSILATFYQSFNMSWNADRYEIVKKDNAVAVFQQVFRFLSAAFIIIGIGLSLFANDFFRIMTDAAFYPAGNIVPLLVLAALLRIFTIFCNFGIMLEAKTRHIAESSWLKAGVAVLAYVSLIPPFGVYGAATALLISNLVELFWVDRHASRLYDMQLQWRGVIIMALAGAVLVAGGGLLPAGQWPYFLLRVLGFCLLLGFVYRLPFWTENDRALLAAVVGRLRRKLPVPGYRSSKR